MAKKKEVEEQVSAIDQILNPENNANVVLINENDEPVEFEQVALVPFEEKLYAILKPVEQFEGVEEDEAVVFSITEEENHEVYLDVETDDRIIDEVFAVYYALYEEATKGEKKTSKKK